MGYKTVNSKNGSSDLFSRWMSVVALATSLATFGWGEHRMASAKHNQMTRYHYDAARIGIDYTMGFELWAHQKGSEKDPKVVAVMRDIRTLVTNDDPAAKDLGLDFRLESLLPPHIGQFTTKSSERSASDDPLYDPAHLLQIANALQLHLDSSVSNAFTLGARVSVDYVQAFVGYERGKPDDILIPKNYASEVDRINSSGAALGIRTRIVTGATTQKQILDGLVQYKDAMLNELQQYQAITTQS